MSLKSNKFKSKIQNWFYFKHLISKDIKDIKEIKKDINTKKPPTKKNTQKGDLPVKVIKGNIIFFSIIKNI